MNKDYCQMLYKTIQEWQKNFDGIVYPSIKCFLSKDAIAKVKAIDITNMNLIKRILNKYEFEYSFLQGRKRQFVVPAIESAEYLLNANNMIILGISTLLYWDEYCDKDIKTNKIFKFQTLNYARMFFDNAFYLLYDSCHFLAEFIMCWLKIERKDLPENNKDKRRSEEIVKRLNGYLQNKAEKLKISRKLNGLISNNDWRDIIDYRNKMVHHQRPLIEGVDTRPSKKSYDEYAEGLGPPFPLHREYDFESIEEFKNMLIRGYSLYSKVFDNIFDIFENWAKDYNVSENLGNTERYATYMGSKNFDELMDNKCLECISFRI